MSSAHITINREHAYAKANNEIQEKRKITITTSHDTVNDAKKLV